MPVDFPSDARAAPSREEHYVLEDLPPAERMLFGSLAYPCFPVALFFGRWDPLVRFHARQGLGLFIAFLLARLWSGFAWSIDLPEVGWVGYVLCVLLGAEGIAHALAQEPKPLRLIGTLADRLPLPLRLAEPPPLRFTRGQKAALWAMGVVGLLIVALRLLVAFA